MLKTAGSAPALAPLPPKARCRCVTVEHFLKVNDLWGWWWWHSDHKITLAAATRGVKSPIQGLHFADLLWRWWMGGGCCLSWKKQEEMLFVRPNISYRGKHKLCSFSWLWNPVKLKRECCKRNFRVEHRISTHLLSLWNSIIDVKAVD